MGPLLSRDIQDYVLGFLDVRDIRALTRVKPFREAALDALCRVCTDPTFYLSLICQDRTMLPPGNHDCMVRQNVLPL